MQHQCSLNHVKSNCFHACMSVYHGVQKGTTRGSKSTESTARGKITCSTFCANAYLFSGDIILVMVRLQLCAGKRELKAQALRFVNFIFCCRVCAGTAERLRTWCTACRRCCRSRCSPNGFVQNWLQAVAIRLY